MRSPWHARIASRTGRLGARPARAVGTQIMAAAAAITLARPSRSESGPATQPPAATARTTTVMVRPAAAGDAPSAALDVRQDRLGRVHVREHRRRAQEERDAGAGHDSATCGGPGRTRSEISPRRRRRATRRRARSASRREQRMRAVGVERLAGDERLEVGPGCDELRRHSRPPRSGPGARRRRAAGPRGCGGGRRREARRRPRAAGRDRRARRAGRRAGGRGGSAARAPPRPPWASPDGGGRARRASRPSRATRPAGRGGGPRARATPPPRGGRPGPRTADLARDRRRGARPSRGPARTARRGRSGPQAPRRPTPRRPCDPSRFARRVRRRQEVADVIGRVLDLRRRERPPLPVGEPLVVAEADADRGLEQPLQRERAAVAREPGRELGVVHPLRPNVVVKDERGQVARRRVHHLLDGRIGHELGHRLERRSFDRVDHGQSLGGRDLDEAQTRRVRPLPHELGVDGAAALDCGRRRAAARAPRPL